MYDFYTKPEARHAFRKAGAWNTDRASNTHRSMTTEELSAEKRIASQLPDDLSHPPVPSQETLEFPGQVPHLNDPPMASVLFEGIRAEEITPDFVCDVMDSADAHDLSVEGVSIRRNWTSW